MLACMDARLDPARALGLEEGDAHVIRNAGGVVTDDEIRSLAISQHLLGTEEIVLIHHTDCGMLTFNDDEPGEARARPPAIGRPGRPTLRRPRRRRARLDRQDQGPARSSRTSTSVRGFVYEVETGKLREVSSAPGAAFRRRTMSTTPLRS